MSPETTALDVRVVRCTSADQRWIECRAELWPETAAAEHHDEAAHLLRAATAFVALLALVSDKAVGFAEVLLRRDPVNGCETSPVAFLEGIWVTPLYRRRGVARLLIAAAEQWARESGCVEFASDALVDNLVSHDFHTALGFVETERVVYFRKLLSDVPSTEAKC
jgi:aminoglycoside 6'-N-acetyltransferase I